MRVYGTLKYISLVKSNQRTFGPNELSNAKKESYYHVISSQVETN